MEREARLAVIGGGPAGLMAAEVALAAGVQVDLYERMGSVGRKFLLAGKGGLNLTHAEPFERFVQRYGGRSAQIESWLRGFDAAALREWARALGVETIVGSSDRVFPRDLKAAPLLRGWVRRLRAQGLRIHVEHRCTGCVRKPYGRLQLGFTTPQGNISVEADAAVLGLGGGSWPELGSDGSWTGWLAGSDVEIAPLRPANCGFDLQWSEHFAQRHAGQPLKPVVLSWRDPSGEMQSQQGELTITANGLEGGLIYAAAAALREAIAAQGPTTIWLDLAPGRDAARLAEALSRPRGSRTLSEHLRRNASIDGVRSGLLHEVLDKAGLGDTTHLARTIKALPLQLLRTRPLAEAISTAGGVRLESLDQHLMLHERPGLFCAGEMLDWEAPTGGYLLSACFASGLRAGAGAVGWLRQRPS